MTQFAGNTKIPVYTKIIITKIKDKEDQDLVGMTGKIVHPFPGYMFPNTKYIAGVFLDRVRKGRKIIMADAINLVEGDEFEVAETRE